jgi:hypothetical protein
MLDVSTRGKRPCLTCFEVFPHTLDYFPFDAMGRGGTRPHCIECYRRKRREAYAANPEPTRRRYRERYAARAAHFKALAQSGQGPSSCSDTKD